MLWTLPLLLALPATTPPAAPANLRFETGRLTHWEGDGFYVTTATGRGPSLHLAACSSDCGPTGRTGLLHRTIVIPPGVGAIRCTAAVVRPEGVPADAEIDVVLEASGRRFLPRLHRVGSTYQPAPRIGPRQRGQLQEYCWAVSAFAGQSVRIALLDRDPRPGCYLICGGFDFIAQEEFEGRQFVADMLQLSRTHKLPQMARLDSRHFLAIGNTCDEFTEHRLYNCETLYALFFDHFRKKGFAVREPRGKLMVAVFDSQAGFEAYLGQTMPSAVTGFYHKVSNRLVVYDYGQNRSYLAGKSRGEQLLKDVPLTLRRQLAVSEFSRQARNFRNDANISTIMHEVSHQLAFNGGLLNREGDAGLWLVEGLACYCESTRNGEWLGIGEPNPQRLGTLARVVQANGDLIPLRDLVRGDDWLHGRGTVSLALLGYAQSWALVRMLLEEQPHALKRYLALVYPRRTPEHRLTDFAQVFGSDLDRLDRHYRQYVCRLLETEHRP